MTFMCDYRSRPSQGPETETIEFIRNPISKTIESLSNIGYGVTASES